MELPDTIVDASCCMSVESGPSYQTSVDGNSPDGKMSK